MQEKNKFHRRDAKDAKEKKIGHRFTQIKHRWQHCCHSEGEARRISKSRFLASLGM